MDVSAQESEVLTELLQINLKRLRQTVEMERQNKFVYPEGTQITKIILQIEEELYIRKHGYKRQVSLTPEELKLKSRKDLINILEAK